MTNGERRPYQGYRAQNEQSLLWDAAEVVLGFVASAAVLALAVRWVLS